LARCQCGGTGCNCVLVAGENVEVTGAGSTPNPFVVTAVTNCAEVRSCLSSGAGIAYDPATGVISAALSADTGNNLVLRPDGLYVPTGAATVTAGCGLTGNGAASTPIRVNTGSWPYTCDVDQVASGVYCDSAGQLRGDPLPMGRFQQNSMNSTLASPPLVPTTADSQVATLTLQIVNPDPCREAMAILFQEVDIDLNLPPNSGGAYGIDGDDMVYFGNGGTSTVTAQHVQSNKLSNLTLAPGETRMHTMPVTMGRGSGSARYARIQATLRAWVFSLPTS
jgi:hypothetical protein